MTCHWDLLFVPSLSLLSSFSPLLSFLSSCVDHFITSLVCTKQKFSIAIFYFIHFFSQTLSCSSLLRKNGHKNFHLHAFIFFLALSHATLPLPIMCTEQENCWAHKKLPCLFFLSLQCRSLSSSPFIFFSRLCAEELCILKSNYCARKGDSLCSTREALSLLHKRGSLSHFHSLCSLFFPSLIFLGLTSDPKRAYNVTQKLRQLMRRDKSNQ